MQLMNITVVNTTAIFLHINLELRVLRYQESVQKKTFEVIALQKQKLQCRVVLYFVYFLRAECI